MQTGVACAVLCFLCLLQISVRLKKRFQRQDRASFGQYRNDYGDGEGEGDAEEGGGGGKRWEAFSPRNGEGEAGRGRRPSRNEHWGREGGGRFLDRVGSWGSGRGRGSYNRTRSWGEGDASEYENRRPARAEDESERMSYRRTQMRGAIRVTGKPLEAEDDEIPELENEAAAGGDDDGDDQRTYRGRMGTRRPREGMDSMDEHEVLQAAYT